MTEYVVCQKPKGCGWWWQTRTVKPHWWSQPRREYMGAYWPGSGSAQRRWISAEQFDDEYSDCTRHLVATTETPQ